MSTCCSRCGSAPWLYEQLGVQLCGDCRFVGGKLAAPPAQADQGTLGAEVKSEAGDALLQGRVRQSQVKTRAEELRQQKLWLDGIQAAIDAERIAQDTPDTARWFGDIEVALRNPIVAEAFHPVLWRLLVVTKDVDTAVAAHQRSIGDCVRAIVQNAVDYGTRATRLLLAPDTRAAFASMCAALMNLRRPPYGSLLRTEVDRALVKAEITQIARNYAAYLQQHNLRDEKRQRRSRAELDAERAAAADAAREDVVAAEELDRLIDTLKTARRAAKEYLRTARTELAQHRASPAPHDNAYNKRLEELLARKDEALHALEAADEELAELEAARRR
jgi:hypothetical protein